MNSVIMGEKRFFNKRVVHFVRDIQDSLSLGPEEMGRLLTLSPTQYYSFLAGRKSLDVLEFTQLAINLGFSIDAFHKNKVDLQVLKKHYQGEESFISERYKLGAYSKKIMIINVLRYVEQHYGTLLKYAVMDFFQIKKAFMENEEDFINVVFFEDIINFLRQRGLADQDVLRIGSNMIQTNSHTHFAQKMSSFYSPKEMYEEYLVDLIKTVERNNDYSLASINNEQCILKSHDRSELQDIFQTEHYGGPNRCLYRVGALAAATLYLGLPCSNVQETTCVHHGHEECTFVINYEIPKFFQERRIKLSQRVGDFS